MKDIAKLKPGKFAVITRNKRLIKSEPGTKLTQLEAAILDWAIFTNCEDWSLIYLLSHPEALELGGAAIQKRMYDFRNSPKVEKYIEKRAAEIEGIILAKCRGQVIREIEEQRLIEKANQGVTREAIARESNGQFVSKVDNSTDLSDEEILSELQRTFMLTEDPKERSSLANAIATYKRKTGGSEIEQNIKRFYMPINSDGCVNCQLYENQRLKLLK